MRRAFLVALFALCVVPSTAGAVTLVNPDGSRAEPFQTWADQARVPTFNGTLVVYRSSDPCAKFRSIACAEYGKSIAVAPEWTTRVVVWHELGHQFDSQMPEWKRDWLGRLLKWNVPWDGVPGHTASPYSYSQAFADLYAECAFKRKMPYYQLQETMLTAGTMARVCRMIRWPQ